MRLPFTQLANEVAEQHGPVLSEALGINLMEAIGGIAYLHHLAVANCPDDCLPSEAPPFTGAAARTLEARLCWKGAGRPAGQWLLAAQELGLVALEGDAASPTSIRVLGMEKLHPSLRRPKDPFSEPLVRLKTPEETRAYVEQMERERQARIASGEGPYQRRAKPATHVYFIQAGTNGPIKIGCSKFPARRLEQLQTAHPEPLRLLAVRVGGRVEEAELHERFKAHRIQGEWFSPVAELLAMTKGAP